MYIKTGRYIIIITVILIGIIIMTNSYQVKGFQIDESFYMKDISNHWAKDNIKDLAYMGILKGDSEGNANPDSNITRAEFLALLLRTQEKDNIKVQNTYEFNDVKYENWYYDIVNIAVDEGILIGAGSKQILPEKEITREEMILMISRIMPTGKVKKSSNYFKDISGSYKYLNELYTITGMGIITGYPDNTFRPKKVVSRAEAATIMNRLLMIENENMDALYEEQEIKNLIEQYINEYIESKNNKEYKFDYNFNHSTGKEYGENFAKSEIMKLIMQKGVEVKETVKEISIDINELTGRLARAKVNNVSTFERVFKDGTSRLNEYNSKKEIFLVKQNGEWKIYNTKYSLSKKERINLAWEYVAVSTPDMSGVGHINGLNVVSPTWFEIRIDKKTQELSKKYPVIYSDNNTSICMLDLGDSKYIDWAHENGYDIWALFKNEFDIEAANKMLNNKESRKKVIELLLEYTEKYKLDGINIDFEYLYYEDRHVLSQFARELALALREMGVITSIDVTKIDKTSIRWSMCYDREALAEDVDYIVLMAYDQNGEWSLRSGSVAQLKWVENAIEETLKQVPSEKILLGVPFYTRLWEEAGGKIISTKAITMQTTQKLTNENNANLTWDEESGQYIARYSKDGKDYTIWVEDANSIALKADLIAKYNLAGPAAWRRGFETADIWDVLAQ